MSGSFSKISDVTLSLLAAEMPWSTWKLNVREKEIPGGCYALSLSTNRGGKHELAGP